MAVKREITNAILAGHRGFDDAEAKFEDLLTELMYDNVEFYVRQTKSAEAKAIRSRIAVMSEYKRAVEEARRR